MASKKGEGKREKFFKQTVFFLLTSSFSFLTYRPLMAVDNGDAYVTSSIGDAVSLNPILVSDTASNDIVGQVYNGLVKYDKDINLVGDLADHWEVGKSGLVLTFHLRKNVRWHDGVAFTAEDVVFTYEKLKDPKIPSPMASDFDDVASVTALDPYTVRVIYHKAFAPGLASWGMGIIAKHIYEKGDFLTNPANRAPIGTGPYRFKEWKTDQYILLQANPDYFAGRPHLENFVYRIIPDNAVQFLELRNHSIDTMDLTPDQFKAYDAIFENMQRYRFPSFKYIYFGFNLRDPLFVDQRVREAIALATDRQSMVQGILLGLGRPISGPFPISSWAYDPTIPAPPYDPVRAKALFAEVGWHPDAKGNLMKDGKPFAFTLMTNQGNKVRELCAEIIQQQLAKIGIRVEIRIIEWSTFIREYLDKKNFQALVMGWQLGRDPDNYAIWHSSQQGEGHYNFVGYANPEVDRLLLQGRAEFNQTRRKKIYHEIHRRLAADLPYIFLYCPDELTAIDRRLIGPEVAPAGLGWNFNDWWVPFDRQKYKTVMTP